jgi:hypothetical protein
MKKYNVTVTEACHRLKETRESIYRKIKYKELAAVKKKPKGCGKERWFLNNAQIEELAPNDQNTDFNKKIKLSKSDLEANREYNILIELN